jgi:hypothetical protein
MCQILIADVFFVVATTLQDEQTPENLSSDEQLDSIEPIDRRHSLLNSKGINATAAAATVSIIQLKYDDKIVCEFSRLLSCVGLYMSGEGWQWLGFFDLSCEIHETCANFIQMFH